MKLAIINNIFGKILVANYHQYTICLHIISFVCWMAGLFYLPRLFVYHVQKSTTQATRAIFQIMEKKLLFVIMNPAMLFTIITGSILAWDIGFPKVGVWLHYKILAAILLIFFHHYLMFCRRQIIKNPEYKSEKFFRIVNEIPTILLIIIVFLAILKPC